MGPKSEVGNDIAMLVALHSPGHTINYGSHTLHVFVHHPPSATMLFIVSLNVAFRRQGQNANRATKIFPGQYHHDQINRNKLMLPIIQFTLAAALCEITHRAATKKSGAHRAPRSPAHKPMIAIMPSRLLSVHTPCYIYNNDARMIPSCTKYCHFLPGIPRQDKCCMGRRPRRQTSYHMTTRK